MSNIRVPTGIPGFDELCEGGLTRDRSYLISGSAGTGKTIFGLQFLYNGITRYGENGIYITTQERPDQVKENIKSFGWDFEAFENEGKLVINRQIYCRTVYYRRCNKIKHCIFK